MWYILKRTKNERPTQKSLNEIREELLKNPDIKREYDRLEEEFIQNKSLQYFQYVCHQASKSANWWKDLDTNTPEYVYATKIALIHSEISEALEYIRKGGMDKHLPHRLGVEVELADAIHRILDLAGELGLDIQGALDEKIEYNRTRPDHQLGNRAKDGGKKI